MSYQKQTKVSSKTIHTILYVIVGYLALTLLGPLIGIRLPFELVFLTLPLAVIAIPILMHYHQKAVNTEWQDARRQEYYDKLRNNNPQ